MLFMRFSVITITFNAEAFLEKTLESVANQEHDSFEHIIWDGGSTDKTLEIASRYDVKIHQGQDGGIADAMNKGAAFASGNILLHLHADDLLENPKVLSFADTAFLQHPHIRWLYGQAYTIDEKGELKSRSTYAPFSLKKLCRYNTITHPATFVERAFFEEVGGFNPQLKYCMDYELWLRLAHLSTPLALPTTFASFREHGGSLSTSTPRGVADEAYQIRNKYTCSLWQKWKSYKTWRKRLEACC